VESAHLPNTTVKGLFSIGNRGWIKIEKNNQWQQRENEKILNKEHILI